MRGGGTLKLTPLEIVAADGEWSAPRDLAYAGFIPAWEAPEAPVGPVAVLTQMQDELGELGAPSETSEEAVPAPGMPPAGAVEVLEGQGTLGPRPGTPSASEPPVLDEEDPEEDDIEDRGPPYGPGNVPDPHLRALHMNILEIGDSQPELTADAPDMEISDVPGGGRCGVHALARSAKLQGLGFPFTTIDSWNGKAAAEGLGRSAQHGWWDDRVMTAVSNPDCRVVWYDQRQGKLRAHSAGDRAVYYTHKGHHFLAAAPRLQEGNEVV